MWKGLKQMNQQERAILTQAIGIPPKYNKKDRRKVSHPKPLPKPNTLEPNFSANRSGDISEHRAVVWLLKQGYEVFRNECCSGPIDIIAVNTETKELLKIDVKTGSIYIRGDGTRKVNHGKLTETQKKLDVKLLSYDKERNTFMFID
jgi:Holliday junction resolvase-like predicted endonuclease